jgi:hypothetical protein
VAIERTYYCDGPDCGSEPGGIENPVHVTTATPPPYLPSGFIETREVCSGKEYSHYFCGWDCLMKFAAAQPVPEVIPFDGGGDE